MAAVHRDLVLWVRRGQADLTLVDGTRVHLDQGDGLRLPATGVRAITTVRGSVVVPLQLGSGGSAGAHRFTVSPPWQSWLLLAYAYQVAPLTSVPGDHHLLLPRIGYPSSGQIRGHVTGPPMPSTGIAAEIAEQLLFDPSLNYSVEDWAGRHMVSASSIRRAFPRETGLTFQAWRARCRMAAAAGLIESGVAVGQAVRMAGYATASGMTRAYRRYFGDVDAHLPWQRLRRGSSSRIEEVIDLLTSGQVDPAASPSLPPTMTRRVVNDFSVLVWVYRGTAQVRVRQRWFQLGRGDAIWLPCGMECQTVMPQGSLLLPIGAITQPRNPPRDPLRTHFDSDHDDFLIYQSVARYTDLRPMGYDGQIARRFFETQLHDQLARDIPLPIDPAARASALAWIGRIGGGTASVPPAQEVSEPQLPMPRQSWEQLVRMQVARQLLASGMPVGSVARRLGYAEAQNFTRAFGRFHGVRPSQVADPPIGWRVVVPGIESGSS